MSEPSTKRQKVTYDLIYWPGIPGRGEHIRLALEASGTPYNDIANDDKDGIKAVQALIDPNSTTDDAGNPPAFAPPALRVPGAGRDGKPLLITQTPNILFYLGDKIGMVPEGDEAGKWHANAIVLTALDLNNETHDTHHPVAVMKYYEDQKEESLKKATDFRENRIPKFLGYFERVLKGNTKGDGKYFVGDKITYADTTVWQVLDGLFFAFPKEMEARKKEFPVTLQTFYSSIKEEKGIKEYLSSGKRLPYSQGIFRRYPELDRQ
ncbi:glutathione S-transferase [Pseudovirgaria hyperparasitica]|uniref:Glutathione S-transferase n=1 Tax=Pseudovirgaria hyperparasitica TaxID=470096 RepID=A0A6A6W4J0_9PEZI|nr:glutathione S-transferase [Pseudovirgaria hyperparasitica]KAF2757848.1 glutathione S-transferase [Pseudovirgaria hyperparasitica]